MRCAGLILWVSLALGVSACGFKKEKDVRPPASDQGVDPFVFAVEGSMEASELKTFPDLQALDAEQREDTFSIWSRALQSTLEINNAFDSGLSPQDVSRYAQKSLSVCFAGLESRTLSDEEKEWSLSRLWSQRCAPWFLLPLRDSHPSPEDFVARAKILGISRSEALEVFALAPKSKKDNTLQAPTLDPTCQTSNTCPSSP